MFSQDWWNRKGNDFSRYSDVINENISVSRVTNITTTMIRGERPLSVVFPIFIEWIAGTISALNESSGTTHFPGLM